MPFFIDILSSIPKEPRRLHASHTGVREAVGPYRKVDGVWTREVIRRISSSFAVPLSNMTHVAKDDSGGCVTHFIATCKRAR